MAKQKEQLQETMPAEVIPAGSPVSLAGKGTPMGLLAHYSALPSTEDAGIMTTLDLTSRGNVALLQAALAGGSKSMWDLEEGTDILLTHVIAHFAERHDDETGEVTAGPMLTFIGPEGNYHTGSKFAFRDLQRISMLVGPPPWAKPIKVRPVKLKSRNRMLYQGVQLIDW